MGLLEPSKNSNFVQTYTEYDTPEALQAQFIFDSKLWIIERARDNRANHNNSEAIQARKQAMDRLNGVLDRYIDAGYMVTEIKVLPQVA